MEFLAYSGVLVKILTLGCPSRRSLWKTWQNFQHSTALLERGSRLTAAQKVWAPFSWWVPKMQGERNSHGENTAAEDCIENIPVSQSGKLDACP